MSAALLDAGESRLTPAPGSPPRLTGPSWNVGSGKFGTPCLGMHWGGGDQFEPPDVRDLTDSAPGPTAAWRMTGGPTGMPALAG